MHGKLVPDGELPITLATPREDTTVVLGKYFREMQVDVEVKRPDAAVGVEVQARWEGGSTWYDATITKASCEVLSVLRLRNVTIDCVPPGPQ